MKRKINLVGQNTLTVSLPKQWTKLHNLSKGNELDVVEEGKFLLLSSHQIPMERTIEVDISKYDNMVGKVLGTLYKAGYDEIKLNYSTSEQLELIKKQWFKSLIGMDLVHISQKYCILKSLASVKPEELENSIRKVFRLLIENTSELCLALKEERFDDMKMIADKDVNINKFADFSRRLLNKYGYTKPKQTNIIYYIVEDLENVGDDVRDLANYLTQYRPKVCENTIVLFERTILFIKGLHKLFYSLKEKDFSNFCTTQDLLIKEIEKYLVKADSDVGIVLSKLHAIVISVYNFTGPFLIKKYFK